MCIKITAPSRVLKRKQSNMFYDLFAYAQNIEHAHASLQLCASSPTYPFTQSPRPTPALLRLRGGGGDGGSTGAESRSSYLAMYREHRPDSVNPEEERLARWTTCQLSGMPLQAPLVCDEIGNIYNKDAVIRALIEKNIPKQLGYITSLKHLTDLQVDSIKGDKPGQPTQFSCPVTGLTFNGKNNFVVIKRGGMSVKGTGYVFSERALKDLPVVVEEIVGGKWTPEDVCKLVSVGEELEERRKALAAERDQLKAEKKSKKASSSSAKRAAVDGLESNGGDVGNGNVSVVANVNGATTSVVGGVSNGVYKPQQQQQPPAAKKAKVDELMPAHANPAIWSSLFHKKEEDDCKGVKKKNTDYMVRGHLKYI